MFRSGVCLFLFCMIVTSTLSCEKDKAPTRRDKRGAALTDSNAPDQQGATSAQQKEVCDFGSVPALTDGAWPTDVSSEVAGGETIEGTCKDGYTGTPSIVCESSGAWSKIRGACVSGDVGTSCPLSSLPALSDGTWPTTPEENAPGETVSGTCNSGFAGTPTIACKADGSWDAPDSPCMMADSTQCTAANLPSIENGAWPSLEAAAIPGITFEGTCASGFTGSPSVDCLPNGTWEPLVGACSEEIPVVKCTNVSSITTHANFGAWTTTEAEAGDDITGTCASGYTGGFSVRCSDSGSWGTPVGGCTPAGAQPCSSLSTLVPLSHGTWQRIKADWGETVTGTCLDGYTGTPSISCQSGNWSSFSAACSPRGCESLSTQRPLSDGTWNTETAAHGTTVQAVCTSGTTASVSCSFGSWGNVVDGCTPPDSQPCSELSTAKLLSNASWPQQTAGWGGSVTATCKPGHVGSPLPPTVTCNSGTWSETTGGSCIPGCKNPTRDHVMEWDYTVRLTAPTAEIPKANVATAKQCESGYYPSGTGDGNPTATCSTAGWSYATDKACIPCNPESLPPFDYGEWLTTSNPYQRTTKCDQQGNPPYTSAQCQTSAEISSWNVTNSTSSSACLTVSYPENVAYRLRQRSTGRYLDAWPGGTGNFYQLSTNTITQNNHQKFTLTKVNNTTNIYKIKADRFTSPIPDRYLDADKRMGKTFVYSRTLQNNNTQKWQFVGTGIADRFKIKQVDTGKCMTAWNNDEKIANRLAFLTTDDEGDWVRWKLIKENNQERFKQLSSGRYLDGYLSVNSSVVTRGKQTGTANDSAPSQKWYWGGDWSNTVMWRDTGGILYLAKNADDDFVIVAYGASKLKGWWDIDEVNANDKIYRIRLKNTSKYLTAYDMSPYAAHLETCGGGDDFIWELVRY